MMAMAMQVAEAMDMMETCFSVRGTETITGETVSDIAVGRNVEWKRPWDVQVDKDVLPMMAEMTWKVTVHSDEFESVLKTAVHQLHLQAHRALSCLEEWVKRDGWGLRNSLFAPVKTWKPMRKTTSVSLFPIPSYL